MSGVGVRGAERFWVIVLLLPTLLGLALGAFGSIAATIGISLFQWDLLSPARWVGFDNYLALPENRSFLKALGNTALFSAMYVPATLSISLVVAVLLNQRIRAVGLFRLIYFIPVVTSPTAVGLVWTWIYSRDKGVLNAIVTTFGGEPVHWLGSDMALYSVVIVNVWGAIGEGMIIFLGGLQAIPRDVYEAATIDGASRFQQFLAVTVPMLLPSIFFQAVLSTIHAFQAFDYVYILTQTGNGGSSLPMLVFNIYREGFNYFRMGNASAQSVVLAVIVLGLTLVYSRLNKRWGQHG
ncbi:MAG: sugar ABC transporter permease [Devosia sp.]|uniref:carbohydrate ABC transporter permease n=1 Tax=Devosia sp. TaxID=1871048 RepID=UPI001AC7C471|nr:sugar ABC transporter permease [Devosia sp.]MBN9316210.1 sugar ABC transporter permease [Devosia sp.]